MSAEVKGEGGGAATVRRPGRTRRGRKQSHIGKLERDARALQRIAAESGRAVAGFVYVIQCIDSGRVKIGKAKDVAKRVLAIQHMSPTRLRLVNVFPDPDGKEEDRWHTEMARYRKHGEWFDLPKVMLWTLSPW